MRELAASDLQCVGDVGEALLRMLRELSGQALPCALKRRRSACREQEQRGHGRGDSGNDRRRLFEDDVGISASDAEAADACTQR